ncbi:MAG: hypothetical protein Q8R16_02190 [bacterium]|nr:hypothetical protein [bacterium]
MPRKKQRTDSRGRSRPAASTSPLNLHDPTLDPSELETRYTTWNMHILKPCCGERDYAAEARMEQSFRRVFFGGKAPPPIGQPIRLKTAARKRSPTRHRARRR